MHEIIKKLSAGVPLNIDEFKKIVENENSSFKAEITDMAVKQRKNIYGNKIYIRGLIEISSFCKNDCYYCGLRRSNQNAERYRLTKEEILECCNQGYQSGFRTFVMQGGEDAYYTDARMTDIVSEIKKQYPDCAVTLSLGEKSYETYKKYREAGADRYLLRHETADCEHYSKLHPSEMKLSSRKKCLEDLKSLGFQIGAGFMVGSPYQTTENLAEDLLYLQELKPHMVGIGPFIPHHDTPFRDMPAGNTELTLYLISIVRLILPYALIPATTALSTVDEYGREKGILAGANVIMPNLSPVLQRKKYLLYDNKAISGAEAAEQIDILKAKMNNIGYEIVIDRGDAANL